MRGKNARANGILWRRQLGGSNDIRGAKVWLYLQSLPAYPFGLNGIRTWEIGEKANRTRMRTTGTSGFLCLAGKTETNSSQRLEDKADEREEAHQNTGHWDGQYPFLLG